MPIVKYMYRYNNCYSTVYCDEYAVLKETRCGYWIAPLTRYTAIEDFVEEERKRYMSKTAKNRYARERKVDAICDFIKRKQHQLEHLRNEADAILVAVREARSILHNDTKGVLYERADT